MLDFGGGNLTPWLIGIGVVVFLVAIIVITVLQLQQQSSSAEKAAGKAAADRALADVRGASTQARLAAEEAGKAATEAENAAKMAEDAAGRMLKLIGDHTVAQSVVDQARQAQGAAAFAQATKAIEQIVDTQIKQGGSAAQAMLDARSEAREAEKAAKEAQT